MHEDGVAINVPKEVTTVWLVCDYFQETRKCLTFVPYDNQGVSRVRDTNDWYFLC